MKEGVRRRSHERKADEDEERPDEGHDVKRRVVHGSTRRNREPGSTKQQVTRQSPDPRLYMRRWLRIVLRLRRGARKPYRLH